VQRALDLVVAGRIDVQAEIEEHAQDGAARIGLHGVAQGEAERRREREGAPCGGLEAPSIVDVARRAEALAHVGGLGGAQEHGRRY
jgi:hypothetical protein